MTSGSNQAPRNVALRQSFFSNSSLQYSTEAYLAIKNVLTMRQNHKISDIGRAHTLLFDKWMANGAGEQSS